MPIDAGRRRTLLSLALSAIGAAALSSKTAKAAESQGAGNHSDGGAALTRLTEKLRAAPRRRDFKAVPMILDNPDLWDSAALAAVIAYPGVHKQVWDNTAIGSPWMNLMRNSLNAQVFSYNHRDFLAVSATHGTAHLALFDQEMWDKYKLADLAGGSFKTNTLLGSQSKPSPASEFQDPKSTFGPSGNNIHVLQSRGAVFMACHNAIWEQAGRLLEKGVNPDKLSHEALAAELTNHLVDGVVLTPGIVATIVELQDTGFHYIA